MPAGSVDFRHLILGLLTQKSMSGYDIKSLLERLGWLIGSPSFGSLYPALHGLQNDGLVIAEVINHRNKPSRKVYSITEAGKQALQEWTNQPVGSSISLKSFVMCLTLADSLSNERLLVQLQQRRDQVRADHVGLEQAAEAMPRGENSNKHLALEYGLALADAELNWLDNMLDRLSQRPPSAKGMRGN